MKWLDKHSLLTITLSLIFSAKGFAVNNFEQDLQLISQYDQPIILKSTDNQSQIVISAQHQGRVLTSTAQGLTGASNGWLDYAALKKQRGSVGGEDRTWVAPIGSKFSLFYAPGKAMTSDNWRVPPALDEKHYKISSQSNDTISFEKQLNFENHQGAKFSTLLERKVSLYSRQQAKQILDFPLTDSVHYVGFGTYNKLTNLSKDWDTEQGLITVWSMAMFQGHDDTISMLAIEPEQALPQRYLYPLYQSRLASKDNMVFYKTDGRYRSKIGVPANISKDIMAAYTPSLKRLTIIKFSLDKNANYPISLEQEETGQAKGDVSNAYNHGNMDGSLLHPAGFYELESAAPLKALKTGEYLEHTHQTFHFFAEPEQLDIISQKLLGIKVSKTTNLFKPKY